MAAAGCDTTAAQFLQGSCRQKLFLPKHSLRQSNSLLLSSLREKNPSIRISLKDAGLRSHISIKARALVTNDVVSNDVENVSDKVIHFYRVPFLQESATDDLLASVQAKVLNRIIGLKTEQCFNIGVNGNLSNEKLSVLKWLLAETYEPENLGTESFLDNESSNYVIVEVGPRLSFTTAYSANAVSVCHSCGLTEINRLERSRRFVFELAPGSGSLLDGEISKFAELVHDRMTECVYSQKLASFENSVVPEEVMYIPVMERGREALEEINEKMGLSFDEQDLQYYTKLFKDDIKRNPTNVELFDIAQSNSEHSRHWFFTGKLVIDGKPVEKTLMQIVKSTLQANPNNSVIGFKDNSSAIRGFLVNQLRPVHPGSWSPLDVVVRDMDILFTAETHNFPCAVAPFPGAETGVGGRIRDTHATGKGSFVGASTAGYCVGNLNMDDSLAPWEDKTFTYPENLASPLQILINASNGASDYGNKFGEPLIQGFTRSFGMRLPNGERVEWLKPIMFSAGIGQIDHRHISKGEPEIGMLVVKIGGPAYRIGMGGGAASSMVSGQNDAELDFNAVQRGDAEMAQKLNRVIRACAEMGEINPIVSIHDQGAGGNCNVVKEIMYPKGGVIDIRKLVVGDYTMSVLELWGAEYQEQDAILVKPESLSHLESICGRERLPMAVIGSVSGDGRIVLIDSSAPEKPPSVDLDLEKVLGDMPQKTFESDRVTTVTKPLDIPHSVAVKDALERVLTHTSVGSKRFLTTKADRCVTGLIAQQQTVGPLQLPLSDVAVKASSYEDITGEATAVGEQPIKGLLNPKAMARLSLCEALNNLVWAKITSLSDVKSSANWMYAAKLDGEGAAMYDAAISLQEAMTEIGVAIDGGKDSLSMAANSNGEVVKAPGNLVISLYAPCSDITKTVTPDLKLGSDGILVHVDLSRGKRRLGGSILAQVFGQLGDDCPDVDDISYVKTVFNGMQDLIEEELISAGHDVSDGGLLVTVLEMAFAGNCGVNLNMTTNGTCTFLETLYAEEPGLVFEVNKKNVDIVMEKLSNVGICAEIIGEVTSVPKIDVMVDGTSHLSEETSKLRDLWEELSFEIERKQRLLSCVELEKEGLRYRHEPSWVLSFTPSHTDKKYITCASKPKVAIIREEGSNGDREMSSAFHAAGFETWDVAMYDILEGSVSLRDFRGIAFVGGFSYADVLGSGKGWAGTIRFNKAVLDQFQEFRNRPDTFSFGVCNGCQLMALLGWVPGPEIGGKMGDLSQPRFVDNESGRFECRFSSVKIEKSPALMLKGMEGSTLGVWSAHGEGRAYFPNDKVFDSIVKSNLVPVKYCDDDGNSTEEYPFNLNGSPLGIAALCSPDGRHLAMMPHPERCFLMWQYPWYPRNWNVEKAGPSPWLRMFQNAREWCS